MKVEKKMIFLGFILFCLVIYIAVSTYGLIEEQFDDAVFIIEEGETKVIEGPVHNMINTIKKKLLRKDFNKNSKEPISDTKDEIINNTKDEIIRKITLKGRVFYESGLPASDIVVELQSEPRYTNTDSNGNFSFENVEEGNHTITLYKDGLVVGKAEIVLSFQDNLQQANYEMLPDGTYIFTLSDKELFISLDIELKNDGGMEITPIGIEVKKKWIFYGREEVPLTVTDLVDGGTITNKSEVNIFGDNKLIAPGFSGQYAFRIDNSKNNEDIDCIISLIESQPKGADIPMKYRLQGNGRYVKGDDSFYDLEELDRIYAGVKSRRSVRYTLEWKWVDTPNDTECAQFGGQEYTLTIKVSKI